MTAPKIDVSGMNSWVIQCSADNFEHAAYLSAVFSEVISVNDKAHRLQISSLTEMLKGWSLALASVGTDGVDGPTDAAGAVIDLTTVSRARTLGLGDPRSYLDDNNAYTFFSRLGDLIKMGPTETNVGDLQVVLVA